MESKRTRDKIIYETIILFGTYGYQNVSMRQIAAAVGIKAGSIYNHFDKKEDILDAVIDKYWEIFSSYHPTFAELKKLAYTLSAREVLLKLCFTYSSDDILIMLYLLRIQFTEQFQNEKIRQLVFDTFLDGRIRDMTDLFSHLMQLGKIPPGNPAALARVWTSTVSLGAMRAAHIIDAPHQDLGEFADFNNYLIDLVCGEGDRTNPF